MTVLPKHSARRRADRRHSGSAGAVRDIASPALAREEDGLPGNDKDFGGAYFPSRSGRYLAEEIAAGSAVLPLLRAAVRRQAIVWCATAVAGLALGLGCSKIMTPRYAASISVQLSQDPTEDILTDIVVAESHDVAALAERTLGLQESLASFQASYRAQWVSRKILLFQVSADSPHDAVRAATAVANAFLRVRGAQIQARQQAIVTSLGRQIARARAQVAALTTEIAGLAARASGPVHAAELARRRAQRQLAQSALASLQRGAPLYETTVRTQTTSLMAGNKVLDPAATLPPSVLRTPQVLSLAGGVGGLVLGFGFVVIAALLSDKARRRDEVAACLAAPVGLSVPKTRARRSLHRVVASSARDLGLRRQCSYLQDSLRADPAGTATLAVVAADDVRSAAQSVAALAVSLAEDGATVMVADLAPGAILARLFGADRPGVTTVRLDRQTLLVAVPEADDGTPAGPVRGNHVGRLAAAAAPDLIQAYDWADVLLTLTTLDPALGAQHLASWATSSVVMVTAGKATATKLKATGEMIRIAGVTNVSAVLVGADKADESFGTGWQGHAESAVSIPECLNGVETG